MKYFSIHVLRRSFEKGDSGTNIRFLGYLIGTENYRSWRSITMNYNTYEAVLYDTDRGS
jgi:hypothetical protein